VRHVARMVERTGVYKFSKANPEGNRQLRRPRNRWEDSIIMSLQELGGGAWTGLIWLRIGSDDGILLMR
jgi:hypothetical protein